MPPKTSRAKPKGPTFISEEAHQLMINKHAVLAWSILFDPAADRRLVDALIMDASCQSRIVGLLDAAQAAQNELTSTNDLHEFVQLAKEYLTHHADDMPASKCRTVADVLGAAALPTKLHEFLGRIRRSVGDDLCQLVGLCYTNRVNTRVCFDEMGGLFSWSCDPIYIAEAAGTGVDGSPVHVNHVYGLRYRLGRMATDYVADVARQAASEEFRQTGPENTLRPWGRLSDQIAAALKNMRTSAPQKEGQDIPLQALLPQAMAAIQNAYRKGHCIITHHRRIKMVASPSGADHSAAPFPPDCTFKLTAYRAYRWAPSHESGRFHLQRKVPVDQMDALGMLLDMCSYYRADAPGTGLGSSDDAAYFAALEDPRTDIMWVAFCALVAHPPFTASARATAPDAYEHVYEKICTPRMGMLHHCREWCEGFSLKSDSEDAARGERRASLHELVQLGRAIAAQCGLAHGGEFTRARIDGYYERRRAPIDCTVRHIRIATFREAVAVCDSYMERHGADAAAEFGHYIARAGTGGVSFTDREEADKFARMKNRERAKREYRAAYPQFPSK